MATAHSQQAEPAWLPYVQIARISHWVKNVFVLPGTVVALSLERNQWLRLRPVTVLLGLLAVCLIASSNYVLNEILDAASDKHHPLKRLRPIPSGRVRLPLAYAEWIGLMLAGLWLSWQVSLPFTATMLALWVMGCVYNIPPLRTKDVPYLDVLSESINNPLRMLAGWYLTGVTAVPPTSLLISYWMVGCYFMAIKRYAECRDLGDATLRTSYRKSFGYYTEQRLLVAIMFYAAHSMLFFGAFIVRYRLELILSFPLVALVMAQYLALAFKSDSAVQRPEGLYREPALMLSIFCCTAVMILLLFVDVPVLHQIFVPTVQVQ
jgi:decaprenyl-phosphate phosphoribosyltransferase